MVFLVSLLCPRPSFLCWVRDSFDSFSPPEYGIPTINLILLTAEYERSSDVGRLRILFPHFLIECSSSAITLSVYNGIHNGLPLLNAQDLVFVLECFMSIPYPYKPSSQPQNNSKGGVPKTPLALVTSPICSESSLEGLLLSLGKYALLCLLKDE